MKKIKKLLIVPAEVIIEEWQDGSAVSFFIKAARYAKRKIWTATSVYDSEIQRYFDIPKILGRDNTFILGELYPHLHSADVPDSCPYPSCHGTPRGVSVKDKDAADVIRYVDAVLVSIAAGPRGKLAADEARKRDIPVAILDARDHQSIYGVQNIGDKILCRGLELGRDYDLYFKNDLPLGCKTDSILPLAPCPVRPESYDIPSLPKEISVFYSGRRRPGRLGCQNDREQTVRLARELPAAFVLEHSAKRRTFMPVRDYWRNLSRSYLALSPSGKSWDSFRHCEVGLAPGTALIAPKPYIETVGPPLRDGINSILYDTEFKDGKYHLKNPRELIEKIEYYLNNPEEREKMANRWAEDVRMGHTVYERSKYIIESIEKTLL